MAIDPPRKMPAEPLDKDYSSLAAAGSLALSLVGVVLLGAYILMNPDQQVAPRAVLITLAGLFAAAAAFSVDLFRGRTTSQQVLLGWWLTVGVITLVMALDALLTGKPDGWELVFGEIDMWVVLTPLLIGSVAGAGLMYLAAARHTRRRYATIVSLSVAAAVTVIVVINLIAQQDYVRSDVQTISRYGLSSRSKQILRAVDQPVELTLVYTGDRAEEEYRPRTLELLEEMAEFSEHVSLKNVTSDAQKAVAIDSLREQVGTRASEHRAFLQNFVTRAERLQRLLEAQLARWGQIPTDSYLSGWGVVAQANDSLRSAVEAVRTAREDVQEAMVGAALPDYGQLVQDVEETLEEVRAPLGDLATVLEMLAGVPEALTGEGRKKVAAALKEATEAIEKTVATVGAPETDLPEKPGEALKTFAEQAGAAARKVTAATAALEAVAGREKSGIIANSRWFQVRVTQMTNVGPMEMQTNLLRYFDEYVAGLLNQLASQAEALVDTLTPDAQRGAIRQVRAALQQIVEGFAAKRKTALEAMEKLAGPDAAAKRIFAAVADPGYFAEPLEVVETLTEQAEALPEPQDEALSGQVEGENILIVQSGGETKIVSFDEMWPQKVRSQMPTGEEEQKVRRIFNGNAAVGSTILGLTREPFGRVLLAYVGPDPRMMQMMRMNPQMRQSLMTPEKFSVLREALERANFTVQEWDLNQPMPPAEGEEPRTAPATEPATAAAPQRTAILLLPPSPRVPMTPQHLGALTDAIDEGTPAIFLAHWMPPPPFPGMPGVYQWSPVNEYLADAWGIRAMTEYRLIAAIPREQRNRRVYQLDAQAFQYLSANTFTAHPVGEPLGGQRTFWFQACPLETVAGAPESVRREPILEVPADEQTIWATRRVYELIQRLQQDAESTFTPHEDDLLPPLTLALAASRDAEGDRAAARVILLGSGGSFDDSYLGQQVPELGEGGGISLTDPPSANADLVVNGLYWLIGREGYIASGPVQIPPVRPIESGALSLLKGLVIIVLPLVILGIGGLVMFFRRG